MKEKTLEEKQLNEPKVTNPFKSKETKQNFKIRLFSTFVLLFLLFAYVVSGALYTYRQDLNYIEIAAYASFICSIFLIVSSTFEMNRATGYKKWWQQMITIFLVIFAFMYPISSSMYSFDFYSQEWTNLYRWAQPWIFSIIIFIIFIIYLLLAITDKKIGFVKGGINFLMALILIIAYKGFTIASLSLITTSTGTQTAISFNTIIWIWMMIVFVDSFAYIGGTIWGKTKLAPKISPKKTWEGTAFGWSLAFFVGVIYSLMFYFFARDFAPFSHFIYQLTITSGIGYPILLYILFSFIFPVIGILGDLLYSWVKRTLNIKDFSKIIPGHGGVLDRLDSITLAWAFLFIIIVILMF